MTTTATHVILMEGLHWREDLLVPQCWNSYCQEQHIQCLGLMKNCRKMTVCVSTIWSWHSAVQDVGTCKKAAMPETEIQPPESFHITS